MNDPRQALPGGDPKSRIDEAERERLLAVMHAASAKAADLVDKLAAAASEATSAEAAAITIAQRLGVRQRRSVADDLALLLGARCYGVVSALPWQRADTGDDAERRLRAVS